MKRIAFYTLGCKVNQADTASMEDLFRQKGYTVVGFDEQADIYLINTCVVTNIGQRKSRQIINRVLRRTPKALTVVTGCYPQTAAEELRAIKGIDVIVGNQERNRIVEIVEAAFYHDKKAEIMDNVQTINEVTVFEELRAGTETGKTRGFLKIQEGCNQYCSYCIIPYARGPLRSRSLTSIHTEIERLVTAGYKEVVLLGIHLGCYGKENDGKLTLFDAIETALSVKDLKRLRLGSLESVEIDDRILSIMEQDERLCRHLHLPLQAGCDKILRAMKRPYMSDEFTRLMDNIRHRIPDIAITTDVITGFPGESEEDFLEGLEFIRNQDFARMHVFPYSRRKGTLAANMPLQVSNTVKQKRAAILGELAKQKQQNFLIKNIGREAEVLFEQPAASGYIEGLTGNYIRAIVHGAVETCGRIGRVKIIEAKGNFVVGELIDICK
ncbi:MAG: tRNA (N(6)-L-threonylcarbamoyladenosine(37)-C(2))-methylthiotransferase MtaB [Phascolarctobacterium sp.]|nr:tRNA (N(6)-L-threonylcarbamoyladenosine(37)-C(2))-methylthiotransferase MtaB [Phascolarctobacterium sp.]